MGPGEAEPAATASRRLPYPGMAAPANSSLCGCRAKVKAPTQRLNLNMTNLTDVAIATDENAAIGNNSRAGSAVHSHQNGVFAILACPEIVLSQRHRQDAAPVCPGVM